jgi:putative ABC transport system permease protein
MSTGRAIRAIAADPAVAWSVPLALGDSHRGFPVLGTTPAYFEHYRYGDRQPLRFTAGQPFSGLFDAVLGAEVATTWLPARRAHHAQPRQRPLAGPGARRQAIHRGRHPGTDRNAGRPHGACQPRRHRSHPPRLAGRGADSRLRHPGRHVVGKFDLQPKTITAFLLGLHQRSAVFRLQRKIADYRGEPLLAVLPGVALDQLWQTVGVVEKTLLGISWLVFAVGLAGLAAVMLASLNERRRELAVLRSVGAGPRHILFLLMLESLLVTLLGVALSLAVVTVAAWLGGPGWPPSSACRRCRWPFRPANCACSPAFLPPRCWSVCGRPGALTACRWPTA